MGLLDEVSSSLALFILEHVDAQGGPLGGIRRRLASRVRATAGRVGETVILRRLALADALHHRARVQRELDGILRLERRLRERAAHHEGRIARSSEGGSSRTALEDALGRLDARGSQEKHDQIEAELLNVTREKERLGETVHAAEDSVGDLREALDLELARRLPRRKRRFRFVWAVGIVVAGAIALVLWQRPRIDLSAGPTRPLAVAREHAQACAFADGSAAIVGGVGVDEKPLASIERFDPRTRAFDTLSMRLPRPTFNHELTRLDEDRFLLTGGEATFEESADRQVLLVDFARSSITEVGLMTYGRRRPKAALLSDGRVLIVGGEDDPRAPDHSTIEIFDVKSGSSRIAGQLPVYIEDFTLTRVPLGFLIAGGQDRKGRALSSLFTFETETGKVIQGKALSQGRHDHTATALGNGKVIVAGGFGPDGRRCATVEIVGDPEASPTAGPAMSRARAFCCAAALGGGRVLVTGGAGGSDVEDEAEVFDFSADRWYPGGRLAESRSNHVMVELKPGVFLLAGGYAGHEVLRSAEILVPEVAPGATSRRADP